LKKIKLLIDRSFREDGELVHKKAGTVVEMDDKRANQYILSGAGAVVIEKKSVKKVEEE